MNVKYLYLILFLAPVSGLCQSTIDKIGIGLEHIGGFGMEFTDASKTMRPFEGTSLDENGYPQSDFRTVVFDARPCCPWLGSVDDPDAFVPALMAGTYKLSFNGQATITSIGDPVLIQNKKYDATTNLTTVDIVVQKGNWLVYLAFANTKRTEASATNTGVTNLRLLRPGYHNRPGNLFRQEFINAVSHFPVIRFMDFVDTNNTNPDFPGVTEWADRVLPSHARLRGAPWEYVIELANITQKDIWINIPVAATDSYVQSLAQLLRDNLHQDAVIYFEYSNEVWNPGFTQYDYNLAAAKAEIQTEIDGVAATTLNDDAGQCDRNDETLWGGRRYVKRMKEIGDIFIETFSPGSRSSFETKIRPVFSWQIGGWIPYYSCVLTWFENVYGGGSVKEHFYGLAGAAYVNAEGAAANATPAQLLAAMISNSEAGRGKKRDTPTSWTTGEGKIGLAEIADIFQIKVLQYETGPDNGGGSATNVRNRIKANRAPGMKDLLLHDLGTNWFDDNLIHGDLAMYFVLCSSYTRYGSWGATEELENMHTPKLKAIYELAGIVEDNEGPTFPGNVSATMSGTDAILTWTEATDNVAVTHYRISDNTGALATVLASEALTVTLADYPAANLGKLQVTAVDAQNNVSGFNSVTTGIEEDQTDRVLTVFPNPFSDSVTVMFNRGGQLVITDMLGQEVFRKQVRKSTEKVLLPLQHLPDGVFYIEMIYDGGRSVARRIVKR
ncbi:MAG: T9SS C-terminal target domain-containing protein [Bacteroidetes bacterium CHB5]|nr:T9SS C-terminal target domain-containing protein [Bacteroidetes bacterium CHB5]